METKIAELTFTAGLHFDVETGSGRTFAFDDEADDGLGPVESLLAALAACTAMDVISIALKKRQPVVTYRIHARGERRDEYPTIPRHREPAAGASRPDYEDEWTREPSDRTSTERRRAVGSDAERQR